MWGSYGKHDERMKGVKAFMCKISGKHPQEGGNDLLHQNDM